MADVNDETFFAWLDGELSGREAEAVASAVAADPALAERAEQHRVLAERLQNAFAPVAAAPVPAGIAAPLNEESANLVSFAGARARRDQALLPLWKQMAAMAATLAVGIAAGNMMSSGASGPITPEDGRLVAAAALESALHSQLASAPASSGPRIGLTFRDAAGNVCRTFTDRAASGLACMEGGDWRIRGLVQAPEGQSSEYRMASGIDPNLAAMVDSAIDGEPFDAAQERAAAQNGWR